MKQGPAAGSTGGDNGRFRKVLLIGIGNEYRSDDGVGVHIAQKIRDKHLATVTVKQESGEGTALMEAWQGFESVILVDALSSASKPGTLMTFDVQEGPVPASFFHSSTHAFGVAEAIELARVMHTLPPRLTLYGIEGVSFEAGIRLSRIVEESAKIVIEQIVHRFSTGITEN
jgi:hydrogenase maturation protease